MNRDDDEDKKRNQGEGDRDAARRYNQHVREFVSAGRPAPAARDARDALDGPEGPELKAAEKRGASAGKPSVVERVKGLVNRVRRQFDRRR